MAARLMISSLSSQFAAFACRCSAQLFGEIACSSPSVSFAPSLGNCYSKEVGVLSVSGGSKRVVSHVPTSVNCYSKEKGVLSVSGCSKRVVSYAPSSEVTSCRGGRSLRRELVSVAATASSSTMGVQDVVEQMDPVQKRLMFDDECILVDEKDNVVGHDSKYNCHLMEKIEAENLLHRAFSVFLFNSKNELLLQKRSATKVTFPLVWTNTCCSHPLYRESELIKEGHLGVRNAAQRKLFDELGIEASDAPVDEFTCLGRILYKAPSDGKWGEHELDYLVFMKRDVEVKPNPEEVADVQYVTKEKLQELVRKAKTGEDGIKLSPWFQLVVENFLYDWWKRIEEGTLLEVADMETIHKLT